MKRNDIKLLIKSFSTKKLWCYVGEIECLLIVILKML